MLIRGCQEGKGTPKLVEVKCPACGECVEVFVKLNGAPGQTGKLSSAETCLCGWVLPEGSYLTEYEPI